MGKILFGVDNPTNRTETGNKMYIALSRKKSSVGDGHLSLAH